QVHEPMQTHILPRRSQGDGMARRVERQSDEASRPPEHNSSRAQSDPGPDRNYRIGFSLPDYVPLAKVRKFERALQDQGPYPRRLAALDQAAYRVRADKSVTARAFRVYDAVTHVSRGEHRCCLFDLDKVAHIAGVSDRTVASKVIRELEGAGA